MSRVDLPSGAWIELLDPGAVTERRRRPVMVALAGLSKTDVEGLKTGSIDAGAIETFSTLNDLVGVAMISAWSFDCPVTVDALQDLPIRDYDAMQKAVAPFVTDLMPDFSADGAADPKAPTAD